MTHQDHALNLDRGIPLNSALAFIEMNYMTENTRTLQHSSGEFYFWTGTHYRKIDDDTVRSQVWYFLDAANHVTQSGNSQPFDPTSRRVTEVIDALKAAANLDSSIPIPSWLGERTTPSPSELLACKNGLLHLQSRRLLKHTPEFFTLAGVPFCYDPNAPEPLAWHAFLASIWGDDADAIRTLQEVFGYCLSSDTRQQKIFLMIGPKRSGKGTIARVLTELLGRDNVAAPTLAGIGTNFGLAPLIGKQLAIIADARISGRADHQVIVERLLSISGEDSLTIDRKYLSAWTGRLPTRILILTNELPRLPDASGALASRFVTLVLKKSFYGREDHGLMSRFLSERPAILNWALDGRDKLLRPGFFVQPKSSAEVAQELEDLGSPIGAFLRDCCVVAEGQSVDVDALFGKWEVWCMQCGRDRPGTKQTFGRDLRAAIPGLRMSQPREGKARNRRYEGMGLKPEAISAQK